MPFVMGISGVTAVFNAKRDEHSSLYLQDYYNFRTTMREVKTIESKEQRMKVCLSIVLSIVSLPLFAS